MKTLKRTAAFHLYTDASRFYVRTLKPGTPRSRRVSRNDADYLLSCGNSFDAACVMDFGVGVFAEVTP